MQMYESFFGLEKRPFSLLPDPDFLFMSDMHRSALTLLEYGLVNQAGFTVITGEIGCGKTTLIRALLERMEEEFTPGLITNTHESIGELLQWVMHAFALEHRAEEKVERYHRIVEFVISEYSQGRRAVLIVDEAQNLSLSALEELRMLSNVNADKHFVLQIILAGQPELLVSLRQPELRQFSQRVAVDYFIKPLEEAETRAYIRHRMRIAGGQPSTFRPLACRLVHRASRGVPRVINQLCDTALVYAYGQQRRRVSDAIIRDVVRDRLSGNRLWALPSVEAEVTTP